MKPRFLEVRSDTGEPRRCSGPLPPRVATRGRARDGEEFSHRFRGNKGRFSLQEDALARRDEQLGLVRKPPEKPIGGKWGELLPSGP